MTDTVVWWKNGDHPLDNTRIIVDAFGVKTMTPGEVVTPYHVTDGGPLNCNVCGQPLSTHGCLADAVNGDRIVHPGDTIEDAGGGQYRIVRDNPTQDAADTIDAVPHNESEL